MKYFILRVEPYWYQVPGGLGIGAQLGSNTSGRGGGGVRVWIFLHIEFVINNIGITPQPCVNRNLLAKHVM